MSHSGRHKVRVRVTKCQSSIHLCKGLWLSPSGFCVSGHRVMDLLTLLSHPIDVSQKIGTITDPKNNVPPLLCDTENISQKIDAENKWSTWASPVWKPAGTFPVKVTRHQEKSSAWPSLVQLLLSLTLVIRTQGHRRWGQRWIAALVRGVYGLATKTVTCILARMDTAHFSSQARSMRSEGDTRV